MKRTDLHVDAVRLDFEDYRYRTPIKFGGVALDRATLLNVHVEATTRSGQHTAGFGSMPLGNVWSWPSKQLGYEETLAAMRRLAERIARILESCTETAHPIDLTTTLEPTYFEAAAELSRDLPEAMPKLAALVVASPFDAALHDALGRAVGLNCYRTYGSDFLERDLGHYLGPDFAGATLDQYVRPTPQPRLPLYHLVGALDPLDEADLTQRVGDGLPETLGDWIGHNGLTHLKVKLNGDDLAWDVARVAGVDRAAEAAQAACGVTRWFYSLDFNEKCANVDYLLDFLARVKELRPAGFARIQYIEQPTARDLAAHRHNVMHAASRLRPVVIDESLLDVESLVTARDMGYTGAALKACKGQTQTLLLAAAAQKMGLFLCVQDLTCPGASFIHSAGLAAHIPGVAALEGNARQYLPEANRPWEGRFPGLFHTTDGTIATGTLVGPGLGFRLDESDPKPAARVL